MDAATPEIPAHMRGRIPSLDGIRAVAILMVIMSHGLWKLGLPESVNTALTPLSDGMLGVDIFFVMSGYLITTLLLKERSKTGRISLRDFYRRRAYRIWPAFYLFLGVMAAVAAIGGTVDISTKALLSAATFTWSYSPWAHSDAISHSWSLALEEQFYLIWPFVLMWSVRNRDRAVPVVLGIIAASWAVRLGTEVFVPEGGVQDRLPVMLHYRTDILMGGCLLALVRGRDWFETLKARAYRLHAPLLAALFLFGPHTFLAKHVGGKYMVTVGLTLEALAIVTLVVWLIERPTSLPGRVLNSRPFIYVGLISYSLYLWQQVFLMPSNTSILGEAPFAFIGPVVLAVLSYHLVEQPFLRLRDRRSAAARARRDDHPLVVAHTTEAVAAPATNA